MVLFASGDMSRLNEKGQPHCETGPATIYSDGYLCYVKNGTLHRDNGPAIITPDGSGVFIRNGESCEPTENNKNN